ncbi:hypothetical protein ACET3X_007701 [Alternaria dauci]|uniref:Xylanolytic transcriptional activator regulatory domain-containing protein n=1 Tax=Alternaria dauci TaxID=48095 RepID=A0ABR3UCP8_9PLEO
MNHNRYPPEGSNSREPKVAIPRIPGQNYHLPPATRAPRVRGEVVSKAAMYPVSQKKGEMLCCHYDLERKDRLKGAQRKLHTLTELLLDVSSQLDDASKKKIEETLASFEDDTPPPLPTPALLRSKRARRASSSHANDDAPSTTSADGGEANVSVSVGSNEDLDFVQEDILRIEQADNTGYMGRNSQVQWLRALGTKIEHPEGESPDIPYGPPGADGDAFNQRAEALRERQHHSGDQQPPDNDQFPGCYFYLDKSNIDIDIGDPHVIPSADTAERLFEYYKVIVHSPFPILGDIFEHQLHTFFRGDRSSAASVACPKWKAVMNLVLAIGTRYSHLISAEWRADDHDHLVYMWRAVHLLQLQSINTLVAQPDQTVIQAFGLLSLYYLTIGHVSRAWYMIGIALRHAQAAGLHLRHEDPSMSPQRRKTLNQIWWSLYSIECVITSITGRPCTVSAIDCTVPPPGTKGTEMETMSRETTTSPAVTRVSESSAGEPAPNASVDPFYVAYVRLDILMNKILSGLYSAQKSAKSWKAAQKEIASLSDELETWALHSLSQGSVAATAAASGHDLSREQLLLYLYYHSAKICITRPCICRLDLRIKGQSAESIRFNQKTAEACIGAALDITSMLPDPPNLAWYYRNGPWWCAVHMIMQALTVLLLELSLDGIHLTIEKSHITSCVDKLIRWLSSMKSVDAISERAYNVVAKVLSKQSKQDAAHRQLPQPQPTDQHQKQHHTQDTTADLQQQHPSYSQPLALQQLDVVWPAADPFNSNDSYTQSNTGNFYHSDISPLNLFYGNPYEATFDQWEWDPAAFEDLDLGQQQRLGGDRSDYQGH